MNSPPIFITGCPRSGTQMMGRVLGNLSDDLCLISEHQDKETDIPEDHSGVEDHRLWWSSFEYEAWDSLHERPLIDVPKYDPDSVLRLRSRYLDIADGRRLVIKNPSHILYPDLVRKVFPDAQFVFCIRNPWHTLQSMIKCGREGFLLRSPRTAACGVSLLLKAATGWHDAMASYLDQRDDGWAVAKYEQIVNSPYETVAEICHRLSIEISDGFAKAVQIPKQSQNSNYYFIKHAYQTSAHQAQVRQELSVGSMYFGYPTTPSDLPGTMLEDCLQYAIRKLKSINKTAAHVGSI